MCGTPAGFERVKCKGFLATEKKIYDSEDTDSLQIIIRELEELLLLAKMKENELS